MASMPRQLRPRCKSKAMTKMIPTHSCTSDNCLLRTSQNSINPVTATAKKVTRLNGVAYFRRKESISPVPKCQPAASRRLQCFLDQTRQDRKTVADGLALRLPISRGARAGDHRKALPGCRPNFLKTMAAGQKPVNAAWNMFSPAKALNRSYQGLKSWESANPVKTTKPAKAKTARSTFMM